MPLGVRWDDLHRLEVTVILTGSDESKPHELPRSESAVTLGLNHRENSPHPPGVSSESITPNPCSSSHSRTRPSVILDLRVLRNIWAAYDAALRRPIRLPLMLEIRSYALLVRLGDSLQRFLPAVRNVDHES
jgi:hypothetical protein